MDKLLIEKRLYESGYNFVAGCDEVGRGPLAGPVVCCAVIMPKGLVIDGADDSKKLSAKKREALVPVIQNAAIAYCIAQIENDVIDEINILQATRLCMKRAVEGLKIKPDYVITDGNMILDIPYKQESIIKGDGLSQTIACASILAKVFRDKLMDDYAEEFPQYGFERNKGYGTKEHIAALKEYGLGRIHRKSFTSKLLREEK